MIASYVGKIFLREYNARMGTSYSAKEFFEKEFYPLFFDHEKYMQWITNSPFVQGVRKGKPPTPVERRERLLRLKEKLEHYPADASVAVGYPSLDALATTSGQVTQLDLPLTEVDYYASWIGGGLGVGVQGGFSIYFDKADILWRIYEGWNEYRMRLNEVEHLRANQVESWNGNWLAHIFREDYSQGEVFQPFEVVKSGQYKGLIEVPTVPWTEVLIGLARQYSDRTLNGYVFSLGQTNITVGFIPLCLPEIERPVRFYIDLFGKSDYMTNAKLIRSLYGTAFGFVQACQMGVIGVRAMEPKDLKPYMKEQSQRPRLPDFSRDDEKQRVSIKTYQTWLLAMLDNKDFWEKAGDAADGLKNYLSEQKKARTDRDYDVNRLLGASHQRAFIEALTVLLEKASEKKSLVELGKLVHEMPKDNVPYFVTLIRFRYAEKMAQV